jgi:hypothetical protein
VTALVVQDVLGGDILKTDVDGARHSYNAIDGRRWDFTMSQFAQPIGYDDRPSSREEALSDTSTERYRLLLHRVMERLGSSAPHDGQDKRSEGDTVVAPSAVAD